MKSKVTTVVPTLNEERHVERAVKSCLALGPVFVVDSRSVDLTSSIASAAGADVVEHEWKGYSAQKNWALDNLPIETDWVMFVDADEWVTADLAREVNDATSSSVLDGYWIPRMTIFFGRRLRHATSYPDYQLRLFRPDRGRFEPRTVHEHVLLEGDTGFLRTALLHESLNGMDEFVERHQRYARLEAGEVLNARRGNPAGQRRGNLLGSWPERRRALKRHVWYRIPSRPFVRFIWMYVVKRGFLDGWQGFAYSKLLASYEAMIDEELRTLIERDDSGLSVRAQGMRHAD